MREEKACYKSLKLICANSEPPCSPVKLASINLSHGDHSEENCWREKGDSEKAPVRDGHGKESERMKLKKKN